MACLVLAMHVFGTFMNKTTTFIATSNHHSNLASLNSVKNRSKKIQQPGTSHVLNKVLDYTF